MIDRRAHGGRRNAGGLIFLSVAWVAVLGLMPQSSGEDDKTGSGGGSTSTNNIKIEYTYLKDASTDKTYDAWDHAGVEDKLKRAFQEGAGQNVYWSKNLIIDTSDAIWDYDKIDSLYARYKKPSSSYPYWVVSVRGLYIDGELTDWLGVTPVTNSPGHDGIPSHPHSILIYDNIDATVASNHGDSRWWSTIAVHEMGHQRAALTHPERSFADHWPEGNETGYSCVMHVMGPEMAPAQVNSILENCRFCGYSSDYGGGVASCIAYNYQRGLD